MKFIFQNCKVVDSQSPWNGKLVDLEIRGQVIHRITAASSADSAGEDAAVHDLRGASVSPGWVDMRVYITDPGFEWKDDLLSLATSAARGGFTQIVGMPNTFPVTDSSDLVYALYSRSAHLPVEILPAGAVTVGTDGKEMAEMYDMFRAGAVAFTDGLNPLQHSGVMTRALQYLTTFGGLLINRPEDKYLAAGGVANESPAATGLGLKGIPGLSEELMIARDLMLLEYTGGCLHLGGISSARSVELIANARSKGLNVTAEVSPQYLYFTDDSLDQFDTNFRLVPPLRTAEDVAALKAGLQSGVIDVISSSHAPQAIEDKKVEFEHAAPGMLMLETCFGLAHTSLGKKFSLQKLIEKFTVNPRKILDLKPVAVKEGEEACLTFFDPDEEWKVSQNHFASRSANTPLLEHKLTGKAVGIFNQGHFVR